MMCSVVRSCSPHYLAPKMIGRVEDGKETGIEDVLTVSILLDAAGNLSLTRRHLPTSLVDGRGQGVPSENEGRGFAWAHTTTQENVRRVRKSEMIHTVRV